jgi:hypothetical protein
MKKKLKLSKKSLKKWKSLGFSADTAKLLLLVPPVQTGWADGYIQSIEQRTIINFAKNEVGIKEDDKEFGLFENWMEIRPADETFALMNEILGDYLDSLPDSERKIWKNRLLRICLEVAQASPQIGFVTSADAKIHREEILQIDKISRLLSISNLQTV